MERKIEWKMKEINLFTKDERIVNYLKRRYKNHPTFGIYNQGAFFKFEGKPSSCVSRVMRWEDDGVKVFVNWWGRNITLPMIKDILEALRPGCLKGDSTYLYLWKTMCVTYQLEIPACCSEYQFYRDMATKNAGGRYRCGYLGSLNLYGITGTLFYEPHYRSPFAMDDTVQDEVEKIFTPIIQDSGNEKLMEDFKQTVREARNNPDRRYYLEDILPFICKMTGKDANTVGSFLNAGADYNITLRKRPSLNKVYYLKFKTGCSITEVQRLLRAEEDFYAVYHWGNAV